MSSTLLEDRGVIQVSGAGAGAFLQGLLTCDLDKLAPGGAAYGALLSPQGKIECDFILFERDGAFLLDCPLSRAAELLKKLSLYKLRSKVDIEDVSQTLAVLARWGNTGAGVPDPRDPRLGTRGIVARTGAADPTLRADYERLRVALGLPQGGVDFAYADAFPHEANMDLLGGVDFRKGCFVGQEVVARVEHRGAARKRVARVSYDGPPPAHGAALMAGAQEIGVMGSVLEGQGLAMTRIDRASEAMAAGVAILVEDRPATLALPQKRA